MWRRVAVLLTASLGAMPLARAQGPEPRITVVPLECMPVEGHVPMWARVDENLSFSSVRVYFRRLHDHVEDFYFVELRPTPPAPPRHFGPPGEGWFEAVLPKPAAREELRQRLGRETGDETGADFPLAAWWCEKELSENRDPEGTLDRHIIEERASMGRLVERHWMRRQCQAAAGPEARLPDLQQLEQWLEGQQYEPTEYYVAALDELGAVVARTETQVVEVRDDCHVELTAGQEARAADNAVGETAEWQEGEEVFHWLCDGIATRIDASDTPRAVDLWRVCPPRLAKARYPAALDGWQKLFDRGEEINVPEILARLGQKEACWTTRSISLPVASTRSSRPARRDARTDEPSDRSERKARKRETLSSLDPEPTGFSWKDSKQGWMGAVYLRFDSEEDEEPYGMALYDLSGCCSSRVMKRTVKKRREFQRIPELAEPVVELGFGMRTPFDVDKEEYDAQGYPADPDDYYRRYWRTQRGRYVETFRVIDDEKIIVRFQREDDADELYAYAFMLVDIENDTRCPLETTECETRSPDAGRSGGEGGSSSGP